MEAEPLRLLVVDDQVAFRAAAVTAFSADERLAVAGTSASAEEALAFLDHHAVDVVLLDVRMPGMGGVAAAAEIRRRHGDVVVVLMSTYERADLSGLDREAVPFLEKQRLDADQVCAVWRQRTAGP